MGSGWIFTNSGVLRQKLARPQALSYAVRRPGLSSSVSRFANMPQAARLSCSCSFILKEESPGRVARPGGQTYYGMKWPDTDNEHPLFTPTSKTTDEPGCA
jgi:hypothetical protein